MEEELLHSLQSMSFCYVVICHSVCLVSIHHIIYNGPNADHTCDLCGTCMLPVNNNIQVVYLHFMVTEQHVHALDSD